MRRVMNASRAAEVRHRIADGENCATIARSFHVSVTTVYNIRDNRTFVGYGPDVSGMTNAARIAEMVKVIKELSKTKSLTETAQVMGVTSSAVLRYAQMYNIKFTRGKRGPKGINVIRKIERTLLRAGFSSDEIAAFKAHGR